MTLTQDKFQQVGTGAVNRTVDDVLLERVSVMDFGAVRDGVTDDSAALNAAGVAASGKTLLIPSGTYNLNSTKWSIDNSITIVMEAGVTISQPSTSTALLEIDDTSEVTIHGNGAILSHDRASAGNNTLYIRGSSNVKVYGLRFENSPKDAIYLGDSVATPGNQNTDIIIKDCEFDGARRQGISAIHVKRLTIDACVFHDISGESPQAGIDLEANPGNEVKSVTITNCKFYDITVQAGLVISNATGVIVDACHFENCLTGITLTAVTSGATPQSVVSVDNATEQWEITGHGLSVGDKVFFTTTGGGVMPTGSAANSVYRVYTVPDVDNITVSTYYKAAPLAITDDGTLPLTLYKYNEANNSNIVISNCIFKDILNQAIYSLVSWNVSISDCVIDGADAGTANIHLQGVDYSSVSDCIIKNITDGEGIFVDGRDTRISNNTIVGSPDEGIRVYGTENSTISGNTLIDCGNTTNKAMDIRYFNDGYIINNRVVDESGLVITYAIDMNDTDCIGNIITGNNLKDSCASNANSLYLVNRENIFDETNVLDDGESYSAHLKTNSTNLGDISHLINTYNKYEGKMIFSTSGNIPYFAQGSAAGDTWLTAAGGGTITPA